MGLDVVIVAISLLFGAGVIAKHFKKPPEDPPRGQIEKIKELEGDE